MIVSLMLTASVVLAVFYVGVITRQRGGIPWSLSTIGYEEHSTGKRWIWTLWIVTVAELLAPCLFDAIPEKWTATPHVFITSLVLLSILPHVRDRNGVAHYMLGVTAGLFSQMCVWFICRWWLLAWFSVPAILLYMILFYYKMEGKLGRMIAHKGILLLEAICAITLYGSLFTYLLTI